MVRRKYQDKQTGQDRYSTKVVAREMQMLDSRSDSQGSQPPVQAQQAPQQSYQQQAPQQAPAPQPGGFDDFDDDIPF